MSQALTGASVGFVKIPVSDFERSRSFYRDTLGLEEAFAVAEFGWAQYETGTVPICLYVPGAGGGSRKPGGDTGVQLRVANARAAYEALQDHASQYGEGEDGTVSFVLIDPDGNAFQVAQVSG